MLAKGQVEFVHFSGAKALNGTLDNTAVVDRTSNYGREDQRLGVVRIAITAHGLLAGPDDARPTSIYIKGTTNYDGVRHIVAVAANYIEVEAKYVAETPAGTELFFVGMDLDETNEFMAFKIHLGNASATSENLTVDIDAEMGSAFDVNIFTQDMNTVKDYIKTYDNPSIPLSAKDIVKITWANTNNETWGITLLSRRFK